MIGPLVSFIVPEAGGELDQIAGVRLGDFVAKQPLPLSLVLVTVRCSGGPDTQGG